MDSLIETISPQPTFSKNIIDDKSLKNVESEKNEKPISTEISAMLFEELRQLRMIIAREKRIPAYMVFDDKTLMEIVEILPDTDELMLQVKGVGPVKLKMYGADFIKVIKKFKTEFNISHGNKKSSA